MSATVTKPHPAIAPIVLACSLTGLILYRMAFVQAPMSGLWSSYLDSCTYPKTTFFRNSICALEPLFKDLVGNEIGKSFMTIFGTAGGVMATYLFIKGGESGASVVFNPLFTIAHTLAGQRFGAGMIGPIVLPAAFAFSRIFPPQTNAAAPGHGPPTYNYTVSLFIMQFLVFVLSTLLSSVPTSSTAWPYVNYAFQLFPLLFLPLAFLNNNSPPPPHTHTKGSAAPAAVPTLSVSVFTFYKYLYAPLWWMSLLQGLNRAYRAYYNYAQNAPSPFTLPTYFMALDLVGFVVMFVGVFAVEWVQGGDEVAGEMGWGEVGWRVVGTGLGSTMAVVFERKQRRVVERAQEARGGKVRIG
ncbi:hypothetical protein R3P38DRAFT_3385801 [Favolaschia claudopus]|uniref:Uncharacterized protein n=1 Tax=Favolaschia claudopus TaxID=2862362 RepID=A0AAW0DUU0_9AGAR